MFLISISIVIFYQQRDKHSIQPVFCKELFGCTPEEFFDKDFNVDDLTQDIHKYSYINSKGDLVLFLTDEQKEAMLNLESLQTAQKIFDNPRIDVTSNYGKITVIAYKETVYDDLNLIYDNINKLSYIRFLMGVSGEPQPDISIWLIYGSTGVSIHFDNWPGNGEQEIDIPYEQLPSMY